MKLLLALAATLLLAQANSVDLEWEDFKKKYQKLYRTYQEHDERKAIFEENLRFINEHNEEEARGLHTYTVGVNNLADLTQSEISKRMTGYQQAEIPLHQFNYLSHEVTGSIPNSIDWRKKGYVTEVKNQGQCGSCWAFSAVGTIEAAIKNNTGHLISLSEQNLIDCVHGHSNGCQGGVPAEALLYVIKNGGINNETYYPYQASMSKKCHYNASQSAGKLQSAWAIPQGSDSGLKWALGTQGPVSVALDTDDPGFHFYKSGVYDGQTCSSSPGELDHGVLAVGYGSEGGQDYYIVKNSWGNAWGENGYIRMKRNRNICGIANMAVYASNPSFANKIHSCPGMAIAMILLTKAIF